ncbi:MAG: flavin monoamine oxidase family protein [Myxococcales bacterium]|jgi:hypothetical protein
MTLTRREFLAAVLGAPVAAAACRRRRPEPTFGGRLLGQSSELGHKLLGAVAAKPGSPREVEVAIVGGGIAGLSAAWRLVRAGFTDFEVLELEPQPGGTSASEASFPWGAHYVPTPEPANRSLVMLLDEMGAIEARGADGSITWDEETLCLAPQERLFYKGHWQEGLFLTVGATADDLKQLEAFDEAMRAWSGWCDAQGRRAFALPTARCSDDPEILRLDRISMARYMDEQGWTSPRLRWWVDYACRDDYGLRLEQTSAWAGIFYFAARLAGPGDEPSEFLTWPEGNGRVVKHLASAIGPRLRTGAMVFDIAPGDSSVEIRLIDSKSGAPESLKAKHVICATPSFLTRRLVAPFRSSPPEHYARFQYTPWVIANVALRDRPGSLGFPQAWDNVFYESSSLGYVVSTHQAAIDRGPTVWTWYCALADGDPKAIRRDLLAAPWKRWADAVIADLEPAHGGIPELIDSIDVWRWGHAMVRPEVGFISSGALQKAREPLGRVHFAHTDLSGLALIEEAHFHGVRAAEAVLRARGVDFESFL